MLFETEPLKLADYSTQTFDVTVEPHYINLATFNRYFYL